MRLYPWVGDALCLGQGSLSSQWAWSVTLITGLSAKDLSVEYSALSGTSIARLPRLREHVRKGVKDGRAGEWGLGARGRETTSSGHDLTFALHVWIAVKTGPIASHDGLTPR